MDDGNGRPYSSADLETLMEISGSLLAIVDGGGHLLRLSESWSAALGWDVREMIGHHFLHYLHPDDASMTLKQLSGLLQGEPPTEAIENRYRHSDGSYRWLRWETRIGPDGATVWCVAHDVTQQRHRADQQHAVAELGWMALEAHDLDELLGFAVAAVAAGLSLPLAVLLQLKGTDTLALRAGIGSDRLPTEVSLGQSSVGGPALAARQATQVYDVQADLQSHPLHRELGTRGVVVAPIGRAAAPWGLLAVGDLRPRHFDATELRFVDQVAHIVETAIERDAAQSQLEHQATHDQLTDLPNRELLRRRLEQALAQEQRDGLPVGLLLCDLDGFKDVNDSLGHSAGDQLLRQVAARLVAAAGPGDTVARLGGDEFALCVTQRATEFDVLGVAEAVVAAMRQPFTLPELTLRMSTSIGVVVSPSHGTDSSTLLRHADVAMYRAKTTHLGWTAYDASLDAGGTDRLMLTAELRAAIADGGLHLLYQPVVDLRTGQLHSVEALCRWQHPVRGPVDPATFIALAEQTGAVLPLTSWVVAEATAQVRRWRAAGHDLRCAVNLSMAAVGDSRASDELLRSLIAASSLLTVEITESWLADARGQEVISELAAGGVRLSLDDFGTGFSSLAALRAYPVQQLKLDQQFLRDLEGDQRGTEVLRAVAQLAGALGMDVVAEGVEEQETSRRLQAAGLRLGQGYLWSAAVEPDDLGGWLADRTEGPGVGGR